MMMTTERIMELIDVVILVRLQKVGVEFSRILLCVVVAVWKVDS